MTRFLLSLLLALAVVSLDATSSGLARLTLVDEDGYNEIEVSVRPPLLPSNDTTILSGAVEIGLEIDTDTDQVRTLAASSGAINGSPITFSRTGLVLRYSASSDALGIDIRTPNPPGYVTSATGEFDASDHQFIVNKGTLTGQVNYLGQSTAIDQDFTTTPFGSTSKGTGTVSIQLTSSTRTSKTYAVELIYPVSTTGTITQSGLTVNILNSGTVKANGSVTVPIPTPFDRWVNSHNLSDYRFSDDSNSDGVPNGIQWALGIGPEDSPLPHLPKLDRITENTVRYLIDFPGNGSATELTVLFTGDLQQDFSELSNSNISVGNPIPSGTSGSVTVELPSGTRGYFQLQAKEP